MNFSDGYFTTPGLDYASSIDFLLDYYYYKRKDVQDMDHTPAQIYNRYIHSMALIYHRILPDEEIKALYECFDHSLG